MPRKSRSSNSPSMPSLHLSQDSSSDSLLSQVPAITPLATRPKRRQPRRREPTPLPSATPTSFVELFHTQIAAVYAQVDAQRRAKLTAGSTRLGQALKKIHGSRVTKARRRSLELRSRAAQKRANLNAAQLEEVLAVNARFEEQIEKQTLAIDDLNKRILELYSEIKTTYETTLNSVKNLSC